MSVMIEAIGVAKKFRRKIPGTAPYKTLRDTLTEIPARIVGKINRPQHEEFWALKDVNFNINEGEVVGIIGRNGAGKSTLLKIISQITAPTQGEIRMHGRVGSLLEVGTGFHPELTGRENVFMNGAVLGMSQAEIRKKFDEIVAFSGVEDFIDTPIKYYSSGMRMRLAFAVAAHLDPEILIVDEVLAVGDADFQKKCLNKMQDVSRSGRTVLFVSHNMNAIQQLCGRVIWLDQGGIIHDDTDVSKIASDYLFGYGSQTLKGEWIVPQDPALNTEYFSLNSFRVCDSLGNAITRSVPNSSEICVQIDVTINKLHPALNFGFSVVNQEGINVLWTATTDKAEEDWPPLKLGRNLLISQIPSHYLNEGIYRLDLFSSLHAKGYFSEPGNTPFSIFLHISGGLSESPYWRDARPGVLAPVLAWRVAAS